MRVSDEKNDVVHVECATFFIWPSSMSSGIFFVMRIMKKSILFLVLSVSLLSCRNDATGLTCQYVYVNDSGHDISCEVVSAVDYNAYMTFSGALGSVAAGERAVAVFYNVSEGAALPFADKVKVIFDGKYALDCSQENLDISHNVCDIDDYVYSESGSISTYTFTFTVADYDYAVENGEIVQDGASIPSSDTPVAER